MQVTIPHKFTRGEAVARVKASLDDARAKIGDQATIDEERWEGDTLHFGFTAQGQSISGTFEVKDTEFDLNAELPFMLRMFEGKIKSTIESQVAQLLK